MSANKNLKIIFLTLLIVALVSLGIILGLNLKQQNQNAPSAYSAVYLSTGDIYFGKLSWFPWPHLDEVWLINKTVDQNNQPQLSVSSLTGAFWGPVNQVYLNPRNIIWWTSLRQNSQLIKYFTNPSLFQQSLSQQAPISLPNSSITPTNAK